MGLIKQKFILPSDTPKLVNKSGDLENVVLTWVYI